MFGRVNTGSRNSNKFFQLNQIEPVFEKVKNEVFSYKRQMDLIETDYLSHISVIDDLNMYDIIFRVASSNNPEFIKITIKKFDLDFNKLSERTFDDLPISSSTVANYTEKIAINHKDSIILFLNRSTPAVTIPVTITKQDLNLVYLEELKFTDYVFTHVILDNENNYIAAYTRGGKRYIGKIDKAYNILIEKENALVITYLLLGGNSKIYCYTSTAGKLLEYSYDLSSNLELPGLTQSFTCNGMHYDSKNKLLIILYNISLLKYDIEGKKVLGTIALPDTVSGTLYLKNNCIQEGVVLVDGDSTRPMEYYLIDYINMNIYTRFRQFSKEIEKDATTFETIANKYSLGKSTLNNNTTNQYFTSSAVKLTNDMNYKLTSKMNIPKRKSINLVSIDPSFNSSNSNYYFTNSDTDIYIYITNATTGTTQTKVAVLDKNTLQVKKVTTGTIGFSFPYKSYYYKGGLLYAKLKDFYVYNPNTETEALWYATGITGEITDFLLDGDDLYILSVGIIRKYSLSTKTQLWEVNINTLYGVSCSITTNTYYSSTLNKRSDKMIIKNEEIFIACGLDAIALNINTGEKTRLYKNTITATFSNWSTSMVIKDEYIFITNGKNIYSSGSTYYSHQRSITQKDGTYKEFSNQWTNMNFAQYGIASFLDYNLPNHIVIINEKGEAVLCEFEKRIINDSYDIVLNQVCDCFSEPISQYGITKIEDKTIYSISNSKFSVTTFDNPAESEVFKGYRIKPNII